ncbi:hypothetical protein QUA41_28615 [Microcoleus sp. Pol11C1]|uniref:hypothetical protein n=1 Tax=unclassified Microcoleus TaxID=2642155 RepID=UPI002FCEEBC7
MAQQTIPVVADEVITLLDGTNLNLESPEGLKWLESAISFRFESSYGHKPFTARKQIASEIGYWYGSRKVEGRVHKKYIGKVDGLTMERLEEVAENLTNLPPKAVGEKEPKTVGDSVPKSRLDALEARLKAVEELLGKLAA